MSTQPHPNAPEDTEAAASCLRAFRERVHREYVDDFGVRDPEQTEQVACAWYAVDARHDHRFEPLHARLPGPRRVLDLASGMGTAVFRALQHGHDAFGIEPDAGKLALTRRRAGVGDLPPGAGARFVRAVGERLPWRDGAFDAVLSYQTLEHVQDPDAVLAEMLRVTRPGGALHLRCPDYRGTFEGHYLLPWLPCMPRPLARLWLRLRGRPARGLDGIVYVTRPRLERALRRAARRLKLRIVIRDLEAERLSVRLREAGLPSGSAIMKPAGAGIWLRRLFRHQMQVNLWVEVRAPETPASAPP